MVFREVGISSRKGLHLSSHSDVRVAGLVGQAWAPRLSPLTLSAFTLWINGETGRTGDQQLE